MLPIICAESLFLSLVVKFDSVSHALDQHYNLSIRISNHTQIMSSIINIGKGKSTSNQTNTIKKLKLSPVLITSAICIKF